MADQLANNIGVNLGLTELAEANARYEHAHGVSPLAKHMALYFNDPRF